MADIQSNINVNIDTSEALANIKALQRQISAFYSSMARSGAAANAAVSNMQSNLINTINQTGKFSATIKTVTNTTEAFTTSLEKNKFSLGQYFRYAGGASKTFGKSFLTEMQTIDKVARERVKTLQTQYITMGRDASGALKAIAVRPLTLDLKDLGTQTAIAAQKQQILNQLLKQGSTNLLNFGKNTQWAGRQLMVGFTIPLSMVGTAAAKTFMKMEEQAIKFKRVYGDSMTPTAETDAMVKQIRDLATEFTKYGVAAEKTMELAATAAAAGKQGAELAAQVREANRLAVLGQVEQQDALSTTISITNAFGVAASDLAKKIDFLNAVENQTVTSIEDLTIAVPKAGPVIKQLGGDVEDLAFFLTAMKEGGINASEGANALKSGLAALINPTGKAADMLAGFGINVKNIVEANKGDVKGLVIDFANALDTLDPLNRARAIEQLFGKFQFSRLSTLFQNVVKDGTQASRVLDLTAQSSSQLAALASKELGTVAASSMFKFQKSVEDLKVALAPIGEIFLKLVTPVIEFGTKILDNFNKLDSGAKNFITGLIAVVGGLGPVLIMTFGLLANGVANIIKGFMLVRRVFTGSAQDAKFLGDQTDYMTQQQLEAAGVAASLEQVHQKLEQRFTSEAGAVNLLSQALERAVRAQNAFQGTNTGVRPAMPKKYAQGVVSVPGPKGAGDIVPAMLAPGEAVVPAKQATKYAALIEGIVADNIPGFRKGTPKLGSMPTGGSQAFGQSKSGGGRSISVPGGYEQAHFDTNSDLSMTIREIKQMMEEQDRVLSRNAQTTFTKIMDLSGEGLDTLLRVWTDKTILLKRELHQLFTSNAPGTPATEVPVPIVKEMLEPGGLGTHAKMYDELTKLGLSEKEARSKVDVIQKELIATLDRLPEGAKIIGDQFDELVQEAYNTIAKVDSSVEQAQARMGRITTFQDKFTKEQIRRVSLGGGKDAGYNTDSVAKRVKSIGSELSGGAIPVSSGMKITGALELATQKTSDEIYNALSKLPDSVRQRLANIRTDSELFAKEFLSAVDELGITFDTAATKIGSSTKKATSKATTETISGVEQGLNEAIQRNSPPKRAIQIGRDYGFALNGALREGIPKAKVAGEAFGLTATTSMTTISPAMMQHLKQYGGRIVQPYLNAQGALVPIAQQRIQILDKEAIAARDAAMAQESYVQVLDRIAAKAASLPQSPLMARPGTPGFIGPIQEETRAVPKTTGNLEKFSNTLRSGSFVLTSLAAAGTMAGGTIGEASTNIMQFSGLIFAATTVIELLVAAQQRQLMAQIAHTEALKAGTIAAGTQMKTGLLATISNFFMFSRGKAGGGKFLTELAAKTVPLKGAFAAAGGGLKGFITVIKNAAINVGKFVTIGLRFVPVLGWIVTAISAFVIITNLVNEAKERERLATEGVADAMITTGKELDALAAGLGKEKVVTAVETIGTTGATGQEAQAKVSIAEQVRANKEIMDSFKADIDAMKTMSQRELKGYQNVLALRLQATGQYTREEIEGIITALQQEAKKTTVKLDFAAIDLTSKDPKKFQKIVDQFARSARDSQSQNLTQEQRTESANVATAGYYETLMATSTALMTGVVNLEQYNTMLQTIRGSLDSLGEVQKAKIVSGMLKTFVEQLPEGSKELGKLALAVQGSNNQMFVMEALTSRSIATITELKEVIGALTVVASGVGGAISQAEFDAAQQVLTTVGKKIAAANKATADFIAKQNTGTTGQKSVFQTATEELSKNIDEINKAKTAYDRLTGAGLGAADAFRAAKDPALAAALATTKVGTAKWKELVLLTKQYAAALKTSKLNEVLANLKIDNQTMSNFGNLSKYLQQMGLSGEDIQSVISDPELAQSLMYATGEGEKGFAKIKEYIAYILKNKELKISILPLEDQFKERMQKVSDWFSNERNALEIQLRIDTKADQDIVRRAQQQIDTLNFQVDDFEAGLTRLENGEEAINEKYDNRIEALDKIISANDRIAEQNKEELNIFQMVARGDISGAAAGIAQLQQQKAKNALEAKRESLEAQRKSELESLTAEVMVNGKKVMMTRNEIEANLKNIKQQIFEIEEKTLEPAQRRIEILTATKENLDASLTVLGHTEDEWLNIANNIELSKTRTTDYLNELQKALDIAKQIPGALAGTSRSGDIVGKQDPVKETDFGKNPKLGVVPKPGGGPGGAPAKTDSLTSQESAVANRNNFQTQWGGGATFREVEAYQHDLKKVNKWESGDKSWMSENNYKESKKKVASFESVYSKRDKVTGEYWSSPTLLKRLAKKEGYIFASGGYISGPGTGTSDSIPALLSNGEYVIRANAVKALGTDTLDRMNYADKNRFADGGSVGRQEAAMAARGKAKAKSNPIADIAKAIFFAPLDMAKDFNKSISNVITGKGDGLDYLNLASAIPVGRITSSASKILKSLSTEKAPLGIGTDVVSGSPLLNPNDSLVKAIVTNQLYHGSRKSSKSFDVNPNTSSLAKNRNWFSADFFGTGSSDLAKEYGGTLFELKMPISQAKNLKILDFYPGAKPVEQQFPGLVDSLKSKGVIFDKRESLSDISIAKKTKAGARFIESPTRHFQLANAMYFREKSVKERQEILDVLTKTFGIGAIRHQSGHNVPTEQNIYSEIFGFFKPNNMKATASNLIDLEDLELAKEAAMVQRWMDQRKSAKKKKANGGLVVPSPEAPPKQLAMGGMVAPKYFANGGMVAPKYFAKGGDVVPAMLTPGEFVVNKHAVQDYGVNNLKAINNGTAPGNSVYNGYNINVNVRSNSNPDQIANAVMTQIRQINSQQVRGNRF